MPRDLVELSAAEAMDLLRSVAVGRIVFSERALPAIRVVNHLVDGDTIIIRTNQSAAVLRVVSEAEEGTVVAYEADELDPESRLGWSVSVLGEATVVPLADKAEYVQRLHPWVSGVKDEVLRIQIRTITGFRLQARDVLTSAVRD